MSTDDIAADRLVGVQAIASFRGEEPRRTRYLIERGVIPVGREGERIVASKQRLRSEWNKTVGLDRTIDQPESKGGRSP
jgi:hypothetical protein